MNTQGHLQSKGGLRGHSVGNLFPYIIMGKGIWGSESWRYQVLCPDGSIAGSYKNQLVARLVASLLKEGEHTLTS